VRRAAEDRRRTFTPSPRWSLIVRARCAEPSAPRQPATRQRSLAGTAVPLAIGRSGDPRSPCPSDADADDGRPPRGVRGRVPVGPQPTGRPGGRAGGADGARPLLPWCQKELFVVSTSPSKQNWKMSPNSPPSRL
jgi:hypothetical protein